MKVVVSLSYAATETDVTLHRSMEYTNALEGGLRKETKLCIQEEQLVGIYSLYTGDHRGGEVMIYMNTLLHQILSYFPYYSSSKLFRLIYPVTYIYYYNLRRAKYLCLLHV